MTPINPPAAATPQFRINARDRLSALLTILVTLIALLAGSLLRNAVESRTKTYADPSGVAVTYPAAWRLDSSDAAGGVVRVTDAESTAYPTVFQVRWIAVDPAAKDDEVLAAVANTLALNRGQELTAFKMFDLTAGQVVKGLPGAISSFVFVDTSGDPFQEKLPTVVLGDDQLARKGNRVYVFSMLSTEGARTQHLPMFGAFVESAKLP